jgi:hypothetical protein
MRTQCALAPCILILASVASQAVDASPPKFLQPGHHYSLRFAGQSPFEKTVLVRVDSDHKKKAHASVTYSVTVFTIVALPGDSWVLAEHPKSIEDAFKWNFKRIAMATLTPEYISALQSNDDGKKQLKTLREQAAAKIETRRTWINLRHVVTISKPRIESSDYKLNTNSTSRD